MRYFNNKLEKYIDENIKDKKIINNIFEVLQIDGKYQQGIFIEDNILKKLINIANNKEKIKILYFQCNDIIDFLIVNLNYYDFIGKLFNNDFIKVIDYIDKKSLNNKEFYKFLVYFSKILEKEKNSHFSFLDFNDILLYYIKESKINNIQLLNKLLNLIEKYRETSNILYDIIVALYEIQHKDYLKKVKEGLISNSYEILIIITEKDPFYFKNEFNSKKNRVLEIFDNVDIKKEKSYFF